MNRQQNSDVQLCNVGNRLPMPPAKRPGGHLLADALLMGSLACGELHGLNRRLDEV